MLIESDFEENPAMPPSVIVSTSRYRPFVQRTAPTPVSSIVARSPVRNSGERDRVLDLGGEQQREVG